VEGKFKGKFSFLVAVLEGDKAQKSYIK